MTTKILVPVDGSDPACRAAAFAATLARALDARLTLLHVFDAPSAMTLGLVALSQERVDAASAEIAAAAFARAEAALEGVHAVRRREVGEPSERIVHVANSGGFDHVVLGSRGLSLVNELLLGSVSERVLRRASCPVTLVR